MMWHKLYFLKNPVHQKGIPLEQTVIRTFFINCILRMTSLIIDMSIHPVYRLSLKIGPHIPTFQCLVSFYTETRKWKGLGKAKTWQILIRLFLKNKTAHNQLIFYLTECILVNMRMWGGGFIINIHLRQIPEITFIKDYTQIYH